MNYKLINRLDPLIYLGLVLVGFILPEVVYRLFLFDFTAEFATNQEAMIVRSIGLPLYFAAMAFFLLGGNAENGKQLNIIRYSGGLGLIAFAVFTDFNGFFLFGLVEIGLAVVTGNSIKKEEQASGSYTTEEQ
ncbi:MAG: hypothetical protein ACPHIU_03270 [Candidatus Actinomarina sp.]|jgi:hypothetical protein|tara:strand:+ start:413 stop:811 length:399 start_codon:yes stop_codon:yes gene_type:complete